MHVALKLHKSHIKLSRDQNKNINLFTKEEYQLKSHGEKKSKTHTKANHLPLAHVNFSLSYFIYHHYYFYYF